MYKNRLSDEIVSAVMENVKEELEKGNFDYTKHVPINDRRFDLLLQAKEFTNSVFENREKEPLTPVTEKLLWAIENLILALGMTIEKEDSGMMLVEKPTPTKDIDGEKAEDITEEVLAGVPKNER